MKKIILITIILLATYFTKAQEIPVPIIDRINTVDYIFEGEVLGSQPFTASNGDIHTSSIIQITKIFKGALQCGTIELISAGGELNNMLSYSTHTLQPEVGDVGVFLCKDNWRDVPAVNLWNANNPQVMGPYFEDQSFISYSIENNQIIAHDILGSYDSLAQLYNVAQLIVGFNYIDCNQTFNFNTPPVIPNPNMVDNFTPVTTQMQDSIRNWITFQKQYYQRKRKRTNYEISYSMTNPMITGTGVKYFEFDVTVTDNIFTKYFDFASIRIKFPTSIFGTSLVANNKVNITRGSLINNPSCYSNPTPTDFVTDAFNVDISETVYSQCKSQITNIPQQIIHVKMEMLNCLPNQQVKMEDTVIFGGFSTVFTDAAFADFPNDTFSTSYDTFNIASPLSIPNCVATITSFSPDTVRGGIGDTLTIKGFQFGPIQGNGNLFFVNGDNPLSNSYIPLEPSDFILWSDTLIKVRVPSIDTGNSFEPIASGKFILQNNVGEKDTSSSWLNIYYSVQNFRKPNSIKVPNVFHNQNNGGYRFYVDTLVFQNAGAMWCIEKALYEWRCATGVNMFIEKDTFGLQKVPTPDYVNHIYLQQNLVGPASTRALEQLGPTNMKPISDIDISISSNPTKPFFYDTLGSVPAGFTDFYAVMLHEIGHAVLHEHVNDTNAIMYFVQNISTSNSVPYSKRKIFIMNDAAAYLGGRKVVNIPLDADAISWGFSSMQILPLCEGYLYYDDIKKVANDIEIFPNPFKNTINVKLDADEALLKIELFNYNGQLVYNYNNEFKSNSTFNLPNHFKSQHFILKITTNKRVANKKVIHE